MIEQLHASKGTAMNYDIDNSAAERIPWLRTRKIRNCVPAMVFAVGLIAGMPPMGGTTEAGQSMEQTNFHQLEGRWVRADVGCILDLQYITGDGRIRAAYFNPRRINITRAELRMRSNGTIRLFVELRDAGYPGCTYDLLYNPKTDSFVGTYFHATRKQTFDVAFVREK